jgi:hypothetical protein
MMMHIEEYNTIHQQHQQWNRVGVSSQAEASDRAELSYGKGLQTQEWTAERAALNMIIVNPGVSRQLSLL